MAKRMARDSRGRFLKRGGRKSRRRTRALVVYQKPALTRRRRKGTKMARRRKRTYRRRGRLGGIAGDLPVMEAAAAAAVGFVLQDAPDAGSFAATIQEQINKLPSLGNRTITAGLALHLVNRFTLRNRYARLGAKALIIGGAFQLGRKKFEATDALLGQWDDAIDADEVSGLMSDQDAVLED